MMQIRLSLLGGYLGVDNGGWECVHLAKDKGIVETG